MPALVVIRCGVLAGPRWQSIGRCRSEARSTPTFYFWPRKALGRKKRRRSTLNEIPICDVLVSVQQVDRLVAYSTPRSILMLQKIDKTLRTPK